MRRSFGIFKNRKGVTAVEFALTAPIVLLMIFATIEISWMMLSSVILESAVRQAGRTGITGYVPQGSSRAQYIHDQINNNLLILDPAKVQFETIIYETFADINKPEPFTDSSHNSRYDLGEPFTDVNGNTVWDEDMGVAGVGGAGAIVVYKVTYPYKMMTPMVSRLFPGNGQFDLRSNMVVRNEPF